MDVERLGRVAVGLALSAVAACNGSGHGSASPTTSPASATPTPPVSPPPAKPVPAGWSAYSSTTIPVSIGRPPGWTVDDAGGAGGFSLAPTADASPAQLTISVRSLDRPTSLPVLLSRQVSFATRSCEAGTTVTSNGHLSAAGLSFATAVAVCRPEGGETGKDESTAYLVAVATSNARQWSLVFRDHADELARDRRVFLTPMLATLAVGP